LEGTRQPSEATKGKEVGRRWGGGGAEVRATQRSDDYDDNVDNEAMKCPSFRVDHDTMTPRRFSS